MPYRLSITETAQKELQRLPAQVKERVRVKCRSLADDPRPPGCRKLRGGESYRIRVGGYRVLYDVEDATQTVTILRVSHRSEAYRDL